MASDPWTSFLDWLTTVMVPSWGGLISLLPYFIVIGVVGPLITLILLMWVWHLLKRRRGAVRYGALQPSPAAIGPGGDPVFPVNEPYCERHALVFPPRATDCPVDGASLSVTCPVDGTVRDVEVDTCPACGTRFVLGATSPKAVVLAGEGPPDGGAAVA